ncbi:MAG: HAD hydrolase-like protein [Bacteroidaceae bacterium]|nr:HAD hydrolase-like protein [Bacteroidaceae bacterium]
MIIDNNTDALIFDMDGTLWDAIDTYAEIWNMAFEQEGVSRHITRNDLLSLIGTPIDDIMRHFVPAERVEHLLKTIADLVVTELPRLGGKLYDGVQEGVAELAKHYRLFMLSNCDELELPIFVRYAGIEPYITDTLAYGNTRLRKAENMQLLAEKYHLQHPVYIGDTAGDCNEAHRAGVPFVWMSYGFGTTDKAQLQFDTFADMTRYFVELRLSNK